MTAWVWKIGPVRAIIMSERLIPRPFALVPLAALPPGTQKGDTVEVDEEQLGAEACVAPRRESRTEIRCSY